MKINVEQGILPENSPQTTRSYGPIQSEMNKSTLIVFALISIDSQEKKNERI